ncbi:hypothetical protein ACUH92_08825 [Dermabacteraceae bacterium CCM 9520]
MLLPILIGALSGAGLFLIVRQFLPTEPDLSDAIERLSPKQLAKQQLELEEQTSSLEKYIAALTEKVLAPFPQLVLPEKDLALVGQTRRTFYAEKGAYALLGLLGPILLTLPSAIIGVPFPLTITIGICLLCCAGFFFIPDIQIKQKANALRENYIQVIAAFIDFVALARVGNASATQSMKEAAEVGEHKLFIQIKQLIERSRYRGTSPWNDLHELGRELDLKELSELADIIKLSGEDGASIWKNLRSHSKTMRSSKLRNEQGQNNAKSEVLALPLTLLATSFVALLIAPALLNIASS